jgi:hypothetical protein
LEPSTLSRLDHSQSTLRSLESLRQTHGFMHGRVTLPASLDQLSTQSLPTGLLEVITQGHTPPRRDGAA